MNNGVSCKVHAHVCHSKPLDHSYDVLLYMHAAHFTCIALYFRFTMEEQAIVLDWAAYTIVGPLDRLESLLCHVTSHCSSDPTVTKMIEDSTLTSEAQVCVVWYQPIHSESELRVLLKLEQDPSFKFRQPMIRTTWWVYWRISPGIRSFVAGIFAATSRTGVSAQASNLSNFSVRVRYRNYVYTCFYRKSHKAAFNACIE